MKTANGDTPHWLPYIGRVFYKDVVGVDPRHADVLRERDLEIFASVAHGMFCRRPVPNEFIAETMSKLNPNSFVVVNFSGDRWHRQLASQRVTVPRSRRRANAPVKHGGGRKQ